jgi:hypothetical protein
MRNKRALAVVPLAWLQKWLKIFHLFINNNLRLHRSQSPLTVNVCSFSFLPLRLTFSLLYYYCWLWLVAWLRQPQWAGRRKQTLCEWNAMGNHLPHKRPLQNFRTKSPWVFFFSPLLKLNWTCR